MESERVEEIRWTSEPSTISRGRGYLASGDYARAASAFKAGATEQVEVHALNAEFLVGVAELGAATQDESHLAAAIAALGAYIQKAKPKKHYYVPEAIQLLADAHVRAKDFAKASQVLGDLTGGQMGKKWVEAGKLKSAQALLAQQKFAEAREVFREVQGSANAGFATEARIGYASCQVGQQQYGGAVESLRELLGDGRNERNTAPPRYGELRARAWIVYGQAEEAAAGGDRTKLQWAAIRYLRAATVGTAGGETFAEALFRAKAVFAQLGEDERVQTLSQRLNQLCPKSPWNR
jgi:hypothetical protein